MMVHEWVSIFTKNMVVVGNSFSGGLVKLCGFIDIIIPIISCVMIKKK